MATDQQRGYLFVYTQNLGSTGWTTKKDLKKTGARDEEGPTVPYTRGNVDGNSQHITFSAPAGEGLGDYPCQKPPWGVLNAVDANTGEILWQRPVGVAKGLPEGRRETGLPYGYAGPTATAGGLVFYAALSDGLLRAFDSLTGEELWSAELGSTGYSQPISFLGSDGRQYVSITVGSAVRAFALPK